MIAIVVCLARDEVRAMRILDELRSAGFREEKISILVPEMAIAGGLSPRVASSQREQIGIWQNLPGLTILNLPNIGRLIGAGPLMLRLNPPELRKTKENLAVTLADAGLPSEHAGYYQENLARGKVLLAANVCCLEDATRLETVFKTAGAEEVLVCAETSPEDPGCGIDPYRRAA